MMEFDIWALLLESLQKQFLRDASQRSILSLLRDLLLAARSAYCSAVALEAGLLLDWARRVEQ